MDPKTARIIAVELWKAGLFQAEIALQLNKSVPWVKKWIRRDREDQSMDDLPRSGRPVKLTMEVKEHTAQLLSDKSVGSVRKAKRKLEDEGIEISERSIRRAAHQMGKKFKKRKKKPALTALQKEKRLRFATTEAKKGTQKMKERYVFYDESLFEAFVAPAGQWVDADADPEPRPRVSHPPQIMVAGAICWWGKSALVRVGEGQRINADAYVDILEHGIIPDIEEVCGRNPWTLVQDNAPPHRAKKTQKWLEEAKVETLQGWPPNSPDLNIIETIWGTMKNHVARKEPKTKQNLWQVTQEAWDSISLDTIRLLLSGWGARLSAVRKTAGDVTKF
jgi:transposase